MRERPPLETDRDQTIKILSDAVIPKPQGTNVRLTSLNSTREGEAGAEINQCLTLRNERKCLPNATSREGVIIPNLV